MYVLTLFSLSQTWRAWKRQRNLLKLCQQIGDGLNLIRRSHLAVSQSPNPSVSSHPTRLDQVFADAKLRGYRSVPTIDQMSSWLVTLCQSGAKINRLRMIWLVRLLLACMVGFSVRALLDGGIFWTFQTSFEDSLIIASAALLLVLFSILFLRLLPEVSDESDDVMSIGLWVEQHLQVVNGEVVDRHQQLEAIQYQELALGISLKAEKLSVLNQHWQEQINEFNRKLEAATEVLPLLEFVGFGSFLALVLGPVIARQL